MRSNNKFGDRKHIRLANYDYSSTGKYFITVCTEGRRCILSSIKYQNIAEHTQLSFDSAMVRRIVPTVVLSDYGRIVNEQILNIPKRFSNVSVDKYVIMPNHIHMILEINKTDGEIRGPTLMNVICAFKSLTTIDCKKYKPIRKLFQTSFYEHIIRNKYDYQYISNYIKKNPENWRKDIFFE